MHSAEPPHGRVTVAALVQGGVTTECMSRKRHHSPSLAGLFAECLGRCWRLWEAAHACPTAASLPASTIGTRDVVHGIDLVSVRPTHLPRMSTSKHHRVHVNHRAQSGHGQSCTACACAGVALGLGGSAFSASINHLRSIFAFRLCASATAAMDTPGRMHSWITAALNSKLCRRRPIKSIP